MTGVFHLTILQELAFPYLVSSEVVRMWPASVPARAERPRHVRERPDRSLTPVGERER